MDDSRHAISNLNRTVSGSLSLATSHHIGLRRLPGVLKEYSIRFPGVTLDLHFMDSEVAHEEIVQGNLELGVITLSPTRHERLKAMPIWHDQLTFVCAVDHPLADTSSIDVETLAGYAAILPDMSTFTGRIVKQMFDQKGLTLILSMSTNYLETIKMLISVQRGTRLYRPVTREHRFLAGSRCSRKSSESNSITCTRLRDLPFSRQTIHGTDWPPKRRTALANLIALRRKGPSAGYK